MPEIAKKYFFDFLRIVLAPSTDPLSHDIQNVLMHPGDENGGGLAMEIDNIKINPNYQPFSFENDVALIKLKKVTNQLSIRIFINY